MADGAAIAQALGDLQATVRLLAEQFKRQDDATNASRIALYERFEMLSVQVLRMTTALEAVTLDVAKLRVDIKTDIMPTIDAYRLDSARKLGIIWAGRMVWMFIVGVAGAIGFTVHEALQVFSKK